jgi:hypothetical protein
VIVQIANLCPIRNLSLSGCENISDEGLDIVTQTLSKLETLNLAGNSGITRFSKLHLFNSMSKLDISNCNPIDPNEIFYLSLNSIVELNLTGMSEIDDSSLMVTKN